MSDLDTYCSQHWSHTSESRREISGGHPHSWGWGVVSWCRKSSRYRIFSDWLQPGLSPRDGEWQSRKYIIRNSVKIHQKCVQREFHQHRENIELLSWEKIALVLSSLWRTLYEPCLMRKMSGFQILLWWARPLMPYPSLQRWIVFRLFPQTSSYPRQWVWESLKSTHFWCIKNSTS